VNFYQAKIAGKCESPPPRRRWRLWLPLLKHDPSELRPAHQKPSSHTPSYRCQGHVLFRRPAVDLTQIHGMDRPCRSSLSKANAALTCALAGVPSTSHRVLCLAPGNKISGAKVRIIPNARSSSRGGGLAYLPGCGHSLTKRHGTGAFYGAGSKGQAKRRQSRQARKIAAFILQHPAP